MAKAPTSLDDFFADVSATARKSFLKKGKHFPLFAVASDGGMSAVPAPWQTHGQKNLLLTAMRYAVDLGEIRYCAFISEVWFSVSTAPADGVIDVANLTPPSQTADRREMLVIVAIDKDNFRFGQHEIKRDGGRVSLVPFELTEAARPEMLSAGFRTFTGERKGRAN